jgi:polyisoprenoid-binding protein YceI
VTASLLAALLLAAPSQGALTFDAAPGSTLSYRLVHRFHTVTGVSRAVEARARLQPDGTLQVMVRVPVESFESGNSNRDAHMREAVDAAEHPFVVFRGVAAGALPASVPGDLVVPLRGELSFRGRTLSVAPSVSVSYRTPRHAVVEGSFPVSLEAFGVERPSLLFVKVEDRIDIQVHLTMEAAP